MTDRTAELYLAMDPAAVGKRLRTARVASGLSQTEVADGLLSVPQLSRIESGKRRPRLDMLVTLAGRLGTTAVDLLTGVPADRESEIRLAADMAELALLSGDGASALTDAEKLLGTDEIGALPDVERRVRRTRARALEVTGDLYGAAAAFEYLTGTDGIDLDWIRDAIGLSRCLRTLGDYARAVELGERAQEMLTEAGLSSSVEAVQLSLTIASVYYESGDRLKAQQLCRRAIAAAEALDSPVARASAYWNAGVIESESGRTEAALPLVRSALSIFEASDDARNAACLRSQLGVLQLQLQEPDAAEARDTLERAARELEWTASSEVDRGYNDVALARARLLLGELDDAREVLKRGQTAVAGKAPVTEAEAQVVEGRLAFLNDDKEQARACFTRASHLLTGVGNDMGAGTIWYELGGLFEEIGDFQTAMDAYRRAGAAAGLHSRTTSSSTISVERSRD